MRTAFLLVSVVALLAATSASAGASAPKQHYAPGDMTLASSVLLQSADLENVWKPESEKPTSDPLACDGLLEIRESDLVETGRAIGPLLLHGSKKALAQSVHVYATAAQADAAWARRTMKKTVLCMQRRMEGSSNMMSWISVTQQYPLALPDLVPHVAGYRVIGDAVSGSQRTKAYLDLLLLSRDRTLTMVLLTSYDAPLPKAFEHRLARTISERLLAA